MNNIDKIRRKLIMNVNNVVTKSNTIQIVNKKNMVLIILFYIFLMYGIISFKSNYRDKQSNKWIYERYLKS